MPKSKQSSQSPTAFDASSWPVVDGCKLVDDCIVAGGSLGQIKRLDNEGYQRTMLLAYINIQTPQDALSFVDEYGFPFVPYKAGSLHRRSSGIARSKSLPGLPIIAYDRSAYLPAAEIIGSAAFIRDLTEMVELLRPIPDVTSLEPYIRLDKYTKEDGEHVRIMIDRQTDTIETYETVSESTSGWVHWRRVTIDSPRLPHEVSLRTWKSKKHDLILDSVKQYLTERLNGLLHGTQPILVLEEGEFIPAFMVSTPWQAMSLALYREVSGHGSIRRCKRTGCHNFFLPKRADREACSDKCQLALWRQRQKSEQGGNSI